MSFDSWMQATRIDLECRRERISWWEFWIPLQLNCKMVPAGGTWLEGVSEGGDGEEGGVKKESVEEEGKGDGGEGEEGGGAERVGGEEEGGGKEEEGQAGHCQDW